MGRPAPTGGTGVKTGKVYNERGELVAESMVVAGGSLYVVTYGRNGQMLTCGFV